MVFEFGSICIVEFECGDSISIWDFENEILIKGLFGVFELYFGDEVV